MTTPAGGAFSQGFTVAGHKIPYAGVAVVVAIVGIFVVLRARSQGAPVIAAGNAPADPAASGAAAAFQPYASMGDLSTGLADLRNAITGGQLQPSGGAWGTVPAPPFNSTAPYLDAPVEGHQADAGFHFGTPPVTPYKGWAWKVPGSSAAVAPVFGPTPAGPGATQYGWEWAALQVPGDLLSFPGGPHYTTTVPAAK